MINTMKLLDAALYYASCGFWVAPLWPKSKEPLRGFKYDQPSRDESIIRYWWSICPEANIGFPTGKEYNSLIVLDLDIDKQINGESTLANIAHTQGISLPLTTVVQSGSGGKHIYYKNVGIKALSGKDVWEGVDILAEGAHVVAPPSIHQCGTQYNWLVGDVTTIENASDELIRLINSTVLSKV